MKTFLCYTLLLSMVACGQVPRATLDSQETVLEFTGKDAEDLIAQFEKMGLKSDTNQSRREYGFHMESIHCQQAPSPHLAASCELTQGGTYHQLDATAGALVYDRFVKNRIPLQLVDGVSVFNLQNIYCVRYEMYRGVSKCFQTVLADN